jgi:leucyl/phenylalanyl-tRNA--protein transferase
MFRPECAATGCTLLLRPADVSGHFVPLFRLSDDLIFPPVALAEPDGLLAIGGDLALPRLLLAYSSGLFPWFNEGDPPLWWSPDPRCIFEPGRMRVSRSLAKTLRQKRFQITVDAAFDAVIDACARVRLENGEGTWLNPELMTAFRALHRQGYAHSVECWADGALAGGIYGLGLGRCFFGESMFHYQRDASKVALHALLELALVGGFELVDCQVANPHLLSLGARQISRQEFLARLRRGGVEASAQPLAAVLPAGHCSSSSSVSGT